MSDADWDFGGEWIGDGQEATEEEKLEFEAQRLSTHVRFFRPKGWCGPVMEYTFAPLFDISDIRILHLGVIKGVKDIEKFYIRDAVLDFCRVNGIGISDESY